MPYSKDPYREREPPEVISDRRNTEYRKLFKSQAGRWVLLDMCKRYGVLIGVHPENLRHESLAYAAGQQALLADILARIHKNPMELKQEMVEQDG
jgi:hypothetical protein